MASGGGMQYAGRQRRPTLLSRQLKTGANRSTMANPSRGGDAKLGDSPELARLPNRRAACTSHVLWSICQEFVAFSMCCTARVSHGGSAWQPFIVLFLLLLCSPRRTPVLLAIRPEQGSSRAHGTCAPEPRWAAVTGTRPCAADTGMRPCAAVTGTGSPLPARLTPVRA